MNFDQRLDHDFDLRDARSSASGALHNAQISALYDRMDPRVAASREGRAAGQLFRALEKAYDAGQAAGRAKRFVGHGAP